MAYQIIEDFKGGLDLRRSAVAGAPGTLRVGTNLVITRGGEVAKRKKLVSKYDLSGANAGLTFGLLAAGGLRFVFGSSGSVVAPSGITYQRLQHPDGSPRTMSDVLAVEAFDGKPYVIAQYDDDSIHHFYDGERVTDWDDGRVRSAMSTNDAIAAHLAGVVNNGQDAVTATSAGAVITLTGDADGTAFTLTAEAENVEDGTDDQTATVAAVTPAVPDVEEVLATGSFAITGGTSSAGVNTVATVLVDGVEIMGGAVDWTTSNSGTATLVAAAITANTSSPNYTATAEGVTVIISAVAGSGSTPNAFVVATTVGGDVTTGSETAFTGGVDAVAGVAQVSTVTIGGTPETGDTFTIFIDGEPYGAFSRPDAKGETAMTYNSKLYSCAGSQIEFCGVNDPTVWSSENDTVPGAGSANLANQDGGSEDLTGTGIHQDNMAIFARNAIQLWSMDVDDDLNAYLRTLKNTGTRSPDSIVSYGQTDTFYLADSGVRSIRPRTNTDTAAVEDIGSPIDDEIIAFTKTLTDAQIEAAAAVIEPEEGRFLLALGARIYVFSFFPGGRVSAWSRWEIAAAEGSDNEVTSWAILNGRLYARAGDTIYLYGGDDNATYPDDSEVTATLRTPFHDGKKPGHVKTFYRFDTAVEGEWTVKLLLNPNDTSVATEIARVFESTWHTQGVSLNGSSTHYAIEMTHSAAGAAKIVNMGIHFNIEGPKNEVLT